MSSVTTKVGIELEVRMGKAEAEIKKLNAELEKAKKNAGATSQGLGPKGLGGGFESLAGKASMAAAAVTAVAFAFDKASQKSMSYQAIQSQLTVGIGQARDATQGLILDIDLMRQSNEAVRDGLVKTEAEFAKMAGLATRLGLSVGKDATESVDLLSNALDKLSPKSLDALGLAVDNEQAYFKYASSIGKAADQLTEAEKKQAMWNAVLEDGEKKLGGTTLQVDSAALSIQQFKTALINFTDEAAVAFTSFLAGASDGLADLLENVADFNAEYGLDGRGGIRAADGNNYFQTQKLRGGAGLPGGAGVAARAKLRQIEESKQLLGVMEKSNQEMRLSMSMLDANAKANDEVTKALEKQNKSRKKKIDLFKEERAEFKRQFGEVEMQRAGTSLGNAMGRDAFNSQLSEAQMAQAGKDAKKAQLDFEKEQAKERAAILDEHNQLLEKSLDAEIRAEKAKQEEIRKTMETRMQVADAVAIMTSQSVELASMGAEAFIKGEKRKDIALKALASSQMVVVGITETVKAVAAFAGFNYIEGAMHVGAAALAFAKAAQIGGGGGGMSVGGGGTGLGSGMSFGGTETGGSVQSSSGGSSSPSNNGPVSEVQQGSHGSLNSQVMGGSGSLQQQSSSSAPQVNVIYMGAPDAKFGDFARKAIKASERKSGNVNS